MLSIPTMRVLMPPMATSTVISHIQQMRQCLDDVRELAEWVTTVDETIITQVNAFNTVLDPSQSESNGENFDYEENLD